MLSSSSIYEKDITTELTHDKVDHMLRLEDKLPLPMRAQLTRTYSSLKSTKDRSNSNACKFCGFDSKNGMLLSTAKRTRNTKK